MPFLTLLDIAKRSGNQQAVGVIEALTRDSILLQRMPMTPIIGTGYTYKEHGSLPNLEWRGINQGVTPSKGTINPLTEVVKILEGRSEVDVILANQHGGGWKECLQEELETFLIKAGHDFQDAVLYGAGDTDPNQILGLNKRIQFGAANCINAGGASGNVTSIYGFKFGLDMYHGIYSTTAVPGVSAKQPVATRYKGIETITDGASKKFDGHVTVVTGTIGQAIKSGFAVAQICNINSANAPDKADIKSFLSESKIDIAICSRATMTKLVTLAGSDDETRASMSVRRENGNFIVSAYGVDIFIDEAVSDTESVKS